MKSIIDNNLKKKIVRFNHSISFYEVVIHIFAILALKYLNLNSIENIYGGILLKLLSTSQQEPVALRHLPCENRDHHDSTLKTFDKI